MEEKVKIFVVIPCYKVSNYLPKLVGQIGKEVHTIIVVDDACPEESGSKLAKVCRDPRVNIIFNNVNTGVGGAVLNGYAKAIDLGADVIVKLDGDGQMDPELIHRFVGPIISGDADYTKGNRFFNLEGLEAMPKIRLLGNAFLSFFTKLSSGYWNLFDPTNGYTAIHARVARKLPFAKISKRYFFESDMLFRLNILRALVVDIPMDAKYENEVSNLKIHKILGEFLFNNLRNFFKRIFYNYYLRDMSVASIELPVGFFLFLFGVIFGAYHWYLSLIKGGLTPVGTVMLAVISVMVGLQLLLSFLAYDIYSVPRESLHKKLL